MRVTSTRFNPKAAYPLSMICMSSDANDKLVDIACVAVERISDKNGNNVHYNILSFGIKGPTETRHAVSDNLHTIDLLARVTARRVLAQVVDVPVD